MATAGLQALEVGDFRQSMCEADRFVGLAGRSMSFIQPGGHLHEVAAPTAQLGEYPLVLSPRQPAALEGRVYRIVADLTQFARGVDDKGGDEPRDLPLDHGNPQAVGVLGESLANLLALIVCPVVVKLPEDVFAETATELGEYRLPGAHRDLAGSLDIGSGSRADKDLWGHR